MADYRVEKWAAKKEIRNRMAVWYLTYEGTVIADFYHRGEECQNVARYCNAASTNGVILHDGATTME